MNARGWWSLTVGVAVVVACGGQASRPSSDGADGAGGEGAGGRPRGQAGAALGDAGATSGAVAHGGASQGGASQSGGFDAGGTLAGAAGSPEGSAGEPSVGGAGGASGAVGQAGDGGAAAGRGEACDPLDSSCGVGSDGCAGLARGVTMTRVVAYQSVEIPLMNADGEVPIAARTAELLSSRETLFRLFFDLESGFAPRELAGRVFIENDAGVRVYFHRMVARYDSQDYYLDSTFGVRIPKDAIQPGTRYAADIVECDGAEGAPFGPRFPTSGSLELGVRPAWPLKVQVVPMRVNGLLPDTSPDALEVYEQAFLAMYPISRLELGVAAPLEVDDAEDWDDMLDRVRARRRSDAPPHDVYYYGMLEPAPTMSEYCQDDCTLGLGFLVPNGSTRARAALRAAIGLAYGDLDSIETMLHEIGHNHGRSHAPCDVDDPEDFDRSFPFGDGRTGVRGWDVRSPSALIESSIGDIMGYCSPAWIGAYSYGGLLARIDAVNGALAFETELDVPRAPTRGWSGEGALGPWRILLVRGERARWGIPIPDRAPASGEAEPALVYDRLGRVVEVVDVYRSIIADGGAASIEVPEPKPGWFSIEVAGAAPVAFDGPSTFAP